MDSEYCIGLLCVILFFFLRIRRPPRSTRTDTLFPYTTLFRSVQTRALARDGPDGGVDACAFRARQGHRGSVRHHLPVWSLRRRAEAIRIADRKSTRLNSSH